LTYYYVNIKHRLANNKGLAGEFPAQPRNRCLTNLFSVQLLCEIAGIPRSSYYKRLNRKPSSREQENAELTQVTMTIYKKVERIFQYRQLTLHMRSQTVM
jgi:hypothetical protein